jgi:hypothetical protein
MPNRATPGYDSIKHLASHQTLLLPLPIPASPFPLPLLIPIFPPKEPPRPDIHPNLLSFLHRQPSMDDSPIPFSFRIQIDPKDRTPYNRLELHPTTLPISLFPHDILSIPLPHTIMACRIRCRAIRRIHLRKPCLSTTTIRS